MFTKSLSVYLNPDLTGHPVFFSGSLRQGVTQLSGRTERVFRHLYMPPAKGSLLCRPALLLSVTLRWPAGPQACISQWSDFCRI